MWRLMRSNLRDVIFYYILKFVFYLYSLKNCHQPPPPWRFSSDLIFIPEKRRVFIPEKRRILIPEKRRILIPEKRRVFADFRNVSIGKLNVTFQNGTFVLIINDPFLILIHSRFTKVLFKPLSNHECGDIVILYR